METDIRKLIEEDDEEELEMEMEMGIKEEEDGEKRHVEEPSGGGSRRCRPMEEKERTKLRERHRRAITARILAGLRRHGNYNLRVRADINDVISALAREAGWVVLPDGTTFPSSTSQTPKLGGVTSASSLQVMPQQITPISSKGVATEYVEYKGVYVPDSSPYDISQSQTPTTTADGGEQPLSQPFVDDKQIVDMPPKLPERDFSSTSNVPVYVMLPLGVINMKCEVVDPDGLLKQLRILKSLNVDGVAVDCWWGIVEAHSPQEYNWTGYKRLFQMVCEHKLKLQVMMSFHECGGNVGDDVCIPLPHWVAEIGRSNPDIFFTDREGRRNPECLSWGIDKERVLRGRTASEVYFDYMRSFRMEFNELFDVGMIDMIQVGLGPCGELRYPSCPVKHGWRYPGIGGFQCYDQYLSRSLRKAAETRGHTFWGRGPDNAGSYNSRPHETGFFCDGGDYDGYYGRFFLNWYSRVLVDHGDRILSLAKLAFEGTSIAAKLSGIHWWYKTASHAAEMTSGFYNSCNRDGYNAIMSILNKHGAALRFTSVEMHILNHQQDFQQALADPDGLVWQLLNCAWDAGVPVVNENGLPCHDREGYNKILDEAKPATDPDGRHVSSFTYLRLGPLLMERHNLMEFEQFVKRMHGEAIRA